MMSVALLIAATAIVTLPLPPAPPAPALRDSAPALGKDEARAMTPQALADALLAPGHAPAVEATVHPMGMDAPAGWIDRIDLTTAGRLDASGRVCVNRRIEIGFESPSPGTDPLTPLRLHPVRIETSVGYQLHTGTNAAPCAVRGHGDDFQPGYFYPAPAEAPRALAVVRLIARQARAPRFPITVDDQQNRGMQDFIRAHPDLRGSPGQYAVITDGRVALAGLAFDHLSSVGHAYPSDELLAPALLKNVAGRPRERWRLQIDFWTIDLVLDRETVAAMAVRRAVPPPF